MGTQNGLHSLVSPERANSSSEFHSQVHVEITTEIQSLITFRGLKLKNRARTGVEQRKCRFPFDPLAFA